MTPSEPRRLRPEGNVGRILSEVAGDFSFEARGTLGAVRATGVSSDSRAVTDGDLYAALPGAHRHGAEFAREAVAAGAVAVLTDPSGAGAAESAGAPVLLADSVRSRLGEVAASIYGTRDAAACLYGVTGTNGKTSVAYLLRTILERVGVGAALSTTAERSAGGTAITSGLTTPESDELHALLACSREHGETAAVIEVSAQALSRHRVDGLLFDVVGFTNLSHDHLDDYSGLEEYFAVKARLFEPDRSRRAVVNVDTPWGERLARSAGVPVTTLTARDADAEWRLEVTAAELARTEFTLTRRDGLRLSSSVPLLGRVMAANAGLAAVMALEAGIGVEEVRDALERDGGLDTVVPGRAEIVSGGRGPVVYVDYGHTPDAFETSLAALRAATTGRIIMVFGADGDRDTTKRAAMGAIAARGADAVVITDFHPRFEDPAAIRAALLDGARRADADAELYEVPDPRAGFRFALGLAGAGDVVFYAGPGHEDYREVAGRKLPYSARDDARAALVEAGWGAR